MQRIVQKLKYQRCRDSTRKTYHSIWKIFGKFYARLDHKPKNWVDKITLFAAYLIEECKLKSGTVKSYISAIKAVLAEDDIEIENNNFILNSLTRACKLKNDHVVLHFPIYKDLLRLVLKYLRKVFNQQPYLSVMYQALFAATYYGLLRVGELTYSPHVITVKNTHVATNKKKVLFILETSKTHNKGDKPQRVKISSTPTTAVVSSKASIKIKDHEKNCPFTLIKTYVGMRPDAVTLNEPFFVFLDRSPVTPNHARSTLKSMIHNIGFYETLYNFHSLRIGRCGDLLKLGLSVETIKKLGRWRSNAVFAYFKQ